MVWSVKEKEPKLKLLMTFQHVVYKNWDSNELSVCLVCLVFVDQLDTDESKFLMFLPGTWMASFLLTSSILYEALFWDLAILTSEHSESGSIRRQWISVWDSDDIPVTYHKINFLT